MLKFCNSKAYRPLILSCKYATKESSRAAPTFNVEADSRSLSRCSTGLTRFRQRHVCSAGRERVVSQNDSYAAFSSLLLLAYKRRRRFSYQLVPQTRSQRSIFALRQTKRYAHPPICSTRRSLLLQAARLDFFRDITQHAARSISQQRTTQRRCRRECAH